MGQGAMVENGIYYMREEYKELIRSLGGTYEDTKKRPIVCLIQSTDYPEIFWAIPMGKLNHRDESKRQRVEKYLNLPKKDIRSCYYHIGRTTTQSIFFISDAFPITEKYIAEEHRDSKKAPYVIRDEKLSEELKRKLLRILKLEDSRENYFRQHITDIKRYLINEIENK